MVRINDVYDVYIFQVIFSQCDVKLQSTQNYDMPQDQLMQSVHNHGICKLTQLNLPVSNRLYIPSRRRGVPKLSNFLVHLALLDRNPVRRVRGMGVEYRVKC